MPKIDKGIEFLTAILCDDVRRERNGKELLIGVYSGQVLLPEMPQVFFPVFWVPFETLDATAHKVQFRLIGIDGHVAYEWQPLVVTLVPDNHNDSITVGGMSILVDTPGTLRLEVKTDDLHWKVLKSVFVKVNPSLQAKSS